MEDTYSASVQVARRHIDQTDMPIGTAEVRRKTLELPDDVIRNICRMAQVSLPTDAGHGGIGRDAAAWEEGYGKEPGQRGAARDARKGLAFGQGVLVTMMRVSKVRLSDWERVDFCDLCHLPHKRLVVCRVLLEYIAR